MKDAKSVGFLLGEDAAKSADDGGSAMMDLVGGVMGAVTGSWKKEKKSEIEQWPLVQAYALTEVTGTGGFFS